MNNDKYFSLDEINRSKEAAARLEVWIQQEARRRRWATFAWLVLFMVVGLVSWLWL